MDVSLLIPAPDTLPAPGWLMNALLIITFTIHILLTNAMLGAGMIGFFHWGKWPGSVPTADLDRGLAKRTAAGIALAVNFGVAPLLFMQVIYGQFIYVSSVLMAVFWVSIFILAIAAYYAVYASDLVYEKLGPNTRWLMALAVVLMILVGWFFTKSIVLMINLEAWPQYFAAPGGAMMQTQDPSTLPRYLHFVAASAALGGLALALWGRRKKNTGHLETGRAMMSRGLVWYGVATIINFVIGAWYLGSLPPDVLAQIFGPNKLTMLVFLLGVVAGLGSIPAAFSRQIHFTVWLSVISVLFMVLFRYAVREAYLSPYWQIDQLPVQTQASALVVFLLVLVLGICLLGYSLKLLKIRQKEVG